MNTDGGFYEFKEKSGRSHCSCHVSGSDDLGRNVLHQRIIKQVWHHRQQRRT